MTLVVIIVVTFLPVIYCGYEEIKLISQLNQIYHFDNNIFLVDPLVGVDGFINGSDMTPRTLLVLKSRDYNFTEFLSKKFIRESKQKFLIVAAKTSSFDVIENLLLWMKKIQSWEIDTKIGIFFTEFASIEEDLKKLCEFFYSYKIVDVFIATTTSINSLNIFSYSTYGALTMTNITNLSLEKYFLNLNSNFQGYQLQVTPFLRNIDEKFWNIVFTLMNASYAIVKNNYRTPNEALENEIDVIPLLFEVTRLGHPHLYIVCSQSLLITVPSSVPYSSFSAFMIAASSESVFGYFSITLTAIVILLAIIRYLHQEQLPFIRSVVDVLNLLANDNGSIKYHKLHRSEVWLIVPLTFVGFVIVNGILSNLQSYLTRPVYQPQMETAEDIYNSQLPLITHDELFRKEVIDVLKTRTGIEDWEKRVLTENTYNNILLPLARGEELADTILRVQKGLGIKAFHKTGIVISTAFYSYATSTRFIFVDRFNDILHQINSAGLYRLWMQQESRNLDRKVKNELVEYLHLANRQTDVELDDFPMIIVYGWATSVIVFAIELVWVKFNQRKNRI